MGNGRMEFGMKNTRSEWERMVERSLPYLRFYDAYKLLVTGAGRGTAVVLDALSATPGGLTTDEIAATMPPGFCSLAAVRTAIRTLRVAGLVEVREKVHRFTRGRKATIHQLTTRGRRVIRMLQKTVDGRRRAA
jgi:hypothetical protein